MAHAAAFALFCVVCTVLAFKRHPIYGLYFYFASTFVFPPGRWWGYVFGDLRWSLISAAVTILAILLHRGRLNAKPLWLQNSPAVLLLLYAALMWLQTPMALDVEAHMRGAVIFSKSIVAFWVVYRVVDTKERIKDVLLAHVLGCTFLGLLAQFAGRGYGARLDGVGGPGIDDANTLGMYLITGAIVAGGLVLSQRGWRRYLSLACVPVILNGFVLTNSRGAFLGLVAGGLVFALCNARQHRKLFMALAVLGFIGMVSITDDKFIERMYTIQDATSESEDADTSARSRVILAVAQLEMFVDYPLGTGHRGTAALSSRYLDQRWLTGVGDEAARSSHNTFLTALVEQGVLGAVLYVALVLWIFGAAWRMRRQAGIANDDPELTSLGAAMVGALVAIFVAGNTADYLLVEVQFWLLALVVSTFQFKAAGNTAPAAPAKGAPIRQLAT